MTRPVAHLISAKIRRSTRASTPAPYAAGRAQQMIDLDETANDVGVNEHLVCRRARNATRPSAQQRGDTRCD